MPEMKKVVLVDDEPDAIEITQAMLRDVPGLIFETANDAESGLEKAREILEETRNIPIIMVTGLASELNVSFNDDDMEKHCGSRPEAYLEKPVNREILRSEV